MKAILNRILQILLRNPRRPNRQLSLMESLVRSGSIEVHYNTRRAA